MLDSLFMAPSLRLEPARPADLPSIMELEGSGFHPAIQEREEVFAARLEAFPAGFLLLREAGGGKPLAYLSAERWAARPAEAAAFSLGHDPRPLHDEAGPLLYLASMALDPARRGEGLGAYLFREGRAAIHAAAPGLRAELLLVKEDWSAARRIYEAAGFLPAASLPDFFPPEAGSPRAALLMERSL